MTLQPDLPVIGRERELQTLLARLRVHGLTGLVAPSFIGKTTLLRNVATRARESFGYLTGYATCDEAGLGLLRSVADLYASWLKQASYRQQAAALWKLRRGSFTSSSAGLMDQILQTLHTAGDVSLSVAARLVHALISNYAGATASFKNPLGIAPALPSQIYDLLKIVQEISQKPILLVVDNFERAPALESEIGLLRRLLDTGSSNLDLHIFLASQPTDSATKQLTGLATDYPNVELIKLGQFQLSSEDRNRLLDFLHSRIPCSRTVSPQDLLTLIDGFPGVISWWCDARQAGALNTVEELVSTSKDAHVRRFTHLRRQLQDLTPNQRQLLAHATLLPNLGTSFPRELYGKALPNGLCQEALQALQLKGILQLNTETPTFDHPARQDAIRAYLIEDQGSANHMTLEAINLIRHLCSTIDPTIEVSIENIFFLDCLMSIDQHSDAVKLSYPYSAICSLATPPAVSPEVDIDLPTYCREALALLDFAPYAITLVGNAIEACLDIATLVSPSTDEDSVLHFALALPRHSSSPLAPYFAARCIVNSMPMARLRTDFSSTISRLRVELLALRSRFPSNDLLIEAHARFLRQYVAISLRHVAVRDAFVRWAVLAAVNPKFEAAFDKHTKMVDKIFAVSLSGDAPSPTERSHAWEIFKDLRALRSERANDSAVALHYAIAAQLISDFAESLEQHESLIADLREICRAYPKNERVHAALTYAIYRRITFDLFRGLTAAREEYLNLLRQIGRRFPDSFSVTWHLFLALIDARDYDYGITGEMRGTYELIDELRRWSQNQVFRWHYAQNRSSRAIKLVADDQPEAAFHFLKELYDLRAAFKDDEDVVDFWIVTLVEGLGDAVTQQKKDQLSAFMTLLEAEEPPIRERTVEFVRKRWGGKAARLVSRRLRR